MENNEKGKIKNDYVNGSNSREINHEPFHFRLAASECDVTSEEPCHSFPENLARPPPPTTYYYMQVCTFIQQLSEKRIFLHIIYNYICMLVLICELKNLCICMLYCACVFMCLYVLCVVKKFTFISQNRDSMNIFLYVPEIFDWICAYIYIIISGFGNIWKNSAGLSSSPLFSALHDGAAAALLLRAGPPSRLRVASVDLPDEVVEHLEECS